MLFDVKAMSTKSLQLAQIYNRDRNRAVYKLIARVDHFWDTNRPVSFTLFQMARTICYAEERVEGG